LAWVGFACSAVFGCRPVPPFGVTLRVAAGSPLGVAFLEEEDRGG